MAADVEAALIAAKTLAGIGAGADAVIVITGSIYLVGEAMRALGMCDPLSFRAKKDHSRSE
jgi:folylpolyglutamate synthase/dihydropteroate synthase